MQVEVFRSPGYDDQVQRPSPISPLFLEGLGIGLEGCTVVRHCVEEYYYQEGDTGLTWWMTRYHVPDALHGQGPSTPVD